ncbi:MAG: sulfotransferase domain-containing protein [Planctomycetota bacterium]
MAVPNLEQRGITHWERRGITLVNHCSYLLARLAPQRIPVTAVTGFPKSGTVWVTQMVSDYLQLPFVDLSFTPVGCPAVIHTHYRVPASGGIPMVYVARDGRDAIVSMYFYLSKHLPDGDHPNVPRWLRRYFRGLKNKANVREFLPKFIEYQFQRPAGCRVDWNAHLDSYFRSSREDVPFVKYENLLIDPKSEMVKALGTLTGEPVDEELLEFAIRKFSFEKQTGRKRGEQESSSFVRKGAAGDWKNHFSREAAEVFHRLAGQTLIKAGYEPDASWVEQVD